MLAWSTTAIAPPDGDIGAYFASLERLAGRRDRIYLPGHGPPATEPQRLLTGLIGFARSREARALASLRRLGRSTPAAMSAELYGDRLDPELAESPAISCMPTCCNSPARASPRRTATHGAPVELTAHPRRLAAGPQPTRPAPPRPMNRASLSLVDYGTASQREHANLWGLFRLG